MRRLTTIHLTDNQKQVLAQITAAATPTLAHERASAGRNIIGARDILVDLKLIELTTNSALVTDIGKKVMQDENLIDDTGELTNDGNKFANMGSDQEQPSQQPSTDAPMDPSQGEDQMGGDAEPGGLGGSEQPSGNSGEPSLDLESIKMIHQFQKLIQERDLIKKLNHL